MATQDYSRSIPGYDRWKLSNGEARAGSFEYEPDEDVELPLTCQECGVDYSFDEKGATAGFCPPCNGHETGSPTVVSQVVTGALGVLLALVVSTVGVLVGCCFIFENSDLAWR
jgi:hypothetical protein